MCSKLMIFELSKIIHIQRNKIYPSVSIGIKKRNKIRIKGFIKNYDIFFFYCNNCDIK